MFCLTYYPLNNNYYLQDVQELKITYNPRDKQNLKALLEKYKDKTIIIKITETIEEIEIQLLKQYYEEYSNIKLIFDFNNKQNLERIQRSEIPFFFSNYVTHFDQIAVYSQYNPTDMYICEELGFFLNKISESLHEKNIRVRVFPNICQSSILEIEDIKTFFIRPEDIKIYKEFVDVFELVSDAQRQQTIYRIYKKGKWIGNLNEIIPSFKTPLNNNYLLNNFGKIRCKCQKRCSLNEKKCSLCNQFLTIANIIEEKDKKIIAKQQKEKNNGNQGSESQTRDNTENIGNLS